MKTRTLVLLALAMSLSALAATAAADGWAVGLGSPWDAWQGREEYRPYFQEMRDILRPLDDREIGSLTLNQLRATALELSVPMQKILHVRRSRVASFVFPGLGQFMNDDVLGGVLFTVGGLAVTAGTLAGGYLLLPQELKFDQLNYFTTPLDGIETAFKSQSLRDYLPTIAVLVGGTLVKGALRHWSSVNAARGARQAISEGRVEFEPRLLMPGPGMGLFGAEPAPRRGIGLGMGVDY